MSCYLCVYYITYVYVYIYIVQVKCQNPMCIVGFMVFRVSLACRSCSDGFPLTVLTFKVKGAGGVAQDLEGRGFRV